jgi:biopolymer transport protein ExbB/TolQ
MAVWIALAFSLAGLVAGLVYAVLRGLSLWRQVKRTGGAFSEETARIAEASEQIQVHLDRASASSERLRAVSERFEVSRAKLEVQLQAVREARHAMRRLLWFLPGT